MTWRLTYEAVWEREKAVAEKAKTVAEKEAAEQLARRQADELAELRAELAAFQKP